MRAAVIDVGSNSIKLLVADRGPGGRIDEVLSRTLEVRIGAGIGSERPHLSPEGMDRGAEAIRELATEARGLAVTAIAAFATSAVRDASNGALFRERVKSAVGLELRILTGLEEAEGIGRGLTTDPALLGLRDFNVYDLGGGSLECLSFRHRKVDKTVSLPLGCVRLTERFVQRPWAPLSETDRAAIDRHVREVLSESGFPVVAPPGTGVVGTGGTLTTARSILAARVGTTLEKSATLLPVASLREILSRVGPLGIEARKAIPGLPASRADVFPTALVTLLAVAELGGIAGFQHSLRNLRWGLAAALLES